MKSLLFVSILLISSLAQAELSFLHVQNSYTDPLHPVTEISAEIFLPNTIQLRIKGCLDYTFNTGGSVITGTLTSKRDCVQQILVSLRRPGSRIGSLLNDDDRFYNREAFKEFAINFLRQKVQEGEFHLQVRDGHGWTCLYDDFSSALGRRPSVCSRVSTFHSVKEAVAVKYGSANDMTFSSLDGKENHILEDLLEAEWEKYLKSFGY